MMKRILVAFAMVMLTVCAMAESVTYRILRYNADIEDFDIQCFGMIPEGASAWFENDFGATAGNRFNQIPRNKHATLHLYGFDGCTINSVTLTMCSNNKAGTAALQVKAGETTLYTMPAKAFNEPEWFGQWVSKDHAVYVGITKEMQTLQSVGQADELQITVKGGTPEGSVYWQSVTVDYTPGTVPTESAMGWAYEKLEKKSTLNDGDKVMIYRSGNVATDIDGMQTSHYLDAIGLASTSDVRETDILVFTLAKTEDKHWTMTNQYGERLGATKAQSLAWDEGVDTWDITLGYDGATIASTNTKYGTLRFNAPEGSYARFWNYTSTSLPLPYLYRRGSQNQPVVSTSLTLSDTNRTVDMSQQDTLVMHYTLLPKTTTDFRVKWESSNTDVAVVRDGIVSLVGEGQTILSVSSMDGGSTATCTLNVQNLSDGINAPTLQNEHNASLHEEATAHDAGLPSTLRARAYNIRGVKASSRDRVVISDRKLRLRSR